MSRGERGSRFGLDGLQQPTIGIREQVMKTQHHDGTRLRRTISQIEPRRGLKFVKSFVRRAALAAVSFTVEHNGANCAPTRADILNARHARALGCTAVYGFCMAVDGFGMASADPERTTPFDQTTQKMANGGPLLPGEDRHHSQRAKAAEGCRQGVYHRMNAASEFAWFGSHGRPVEITGTMGHHGQRTRGYRIRLAKGTARGTAGWQ